MHKSRTPRVAEYIAPYPTTLADRLNITYPDTDWRSPKYKGPPTAEELDRARGGRSQARPAARATAARAGHRPLLLLQGHG